jgi:hypothetical protein
VSALGLGEFEQYRPFLAGSAIGEPSIERGLCAFVGQSASPGP